MALSTAPRCGKEDALLKSLEALHLDDLVCALVSKLPRIAADAQDGCGSDEILLDTNIEGKRYLLVRIPAAPSSLSSLSPREQEIVRMVAKGYSNKIIADVLNISSWTVCTHLRRIFGKLGVASRAAMVGQMLKEGWLRDHAYPAGRPAQGVQKKPDTARPSATIDRISDDETRLTRRSSSRTTAPQSSAMDETPERARSLGCAVDAKDRL